MKTKKLVMLLSAVATLVCGIVVFSLKCTKDIPKTLFESNLDVLAYTECPGEKENCMKCENGHCYYYYNGRNYNIAGSENRK